MLDVMLSFGLSSTQYIFLCQNWGPAVGEALQGIPEMGATCGDSEWDSTGQIWTGHLSAGGRGEYWFMFYWKYIDLFTHGQDYSSTCFIAEIFSYIDFESKNAAW